VDGGWLKGLIDVDVDVGVKLEEPPNKVQKASESF
jgi:hypothetical protein